YTHDILAGAAVMLLLYSFPTRRSSDLPELEITGCSNPVRSSMPAMTDILPPAQHRTCRKSMSMRWAILGFTKVAQSIWVPMNTRSEEHTSELQSRENLVCRLLLEKKQL